MDVKDEQPLQNMDVFCKYQSVVDAQLEAFIASERLSQEEVFEACRRVKESNDSAWITCVDYLLAATDYAHFVQLVADFQGLEMWEAEGASEPLEEGAGGYDYGITV